MELKTEGYNLDPSSNFFDYADSVCRMLCEQAKKVKELLETPEPFAESGERRSTVIIIERI